MYESFYCKVLVGPYKIQEALNISDLLTFMQTENMYSGSIEIDTTLPHLNCCTDYEQINNTYPGGISAAKRIPMKDGM